MQQKTGHSLKEHRCTEFEVPVGISLEDGLSEDDAVALALWNNAALHETLADLQLSRADLLLASMLPNPSLSMLLPVGAKPLELTAKYPIEFFWLRPRRVAFAKLDYEKTSASLVQNAIDLVRDVKVAFADLAAADVSKKVLENSVKLLAEIAEMAKARVAAGEASELETALANTDALQMREQLSRSRQEREIATDRLSHLIGLGSKTFGIHLIDSPLPFYKKDQLDLRVTSALAARPDLRSAGLAIAAAGKRVGLAKAEVLTFTAALNAKEVGNDFLTGPGFDISIPILNQNQGNIALARANLEKSARHYLVIRDRVILEVREAHHRLEQAQESLETWQKRIFPPLRENIKQTQIAFELGETSFLLVLEATRKFADAEMKVATANADARRAFAELERSVGGRLDGLISK